MNKKLILSGSIIIGFICLGIMISFAQDGNIVRNPGFDDASEWNYHYWNPYSFSEWEGSVGHTAIGSGYMQRILYSTLDGPVYFYQPILIVTPSENYSGSFWLYDDTDWLGEDYSCGNPPYTIWWAVVPTSRGEICPDVGGPDQCDWNDALVWGDARCSNTDLWEEFEIDFSVPGDFTDTVYLVFYGWSSDGDDTFCTNHYWDDVSIAYSVPITPTPTPTPTIWGGNLCSLANYSFSDGLDEWESGDWVTEGAGWVQIHGNTDQLNSYIAQGIELTATGPSDYYELSISARSPVPVAPENAPFLRWKLNSLIPGDDPDWYGGQALIFSSNYWQHQSWLLRGSNSPAISDTLTIWASGNGDEDVQIDNVCITLHQGPATATPICPPSPTYTPGPTYTPLPTPTAVNSATATAWAATATAWPTQAPYPTQAAPNCSAGGGNEPDWSFIWLMGQIIMLLGAFFEAVFRLLGMVLQPIFDLIGFVVWLLGAAFGLIAQLIDLISAALQFLIFLLEIAFDILEIIGAFFVALWNVISASPADPGFVIPSDWGWPIAAWNFLIEGTPLELLEPVAMAIGSLLMILWTIRQFSPGEG